MARHAATLDGSERLQRLYDVLSRGGRYSTKELSELAGVYAVGSAVSELRHRLKAEGKDVVCERRGEYFYYELTDLQRSLW